MLPLIILQEFLSVGNPFSTHICHLQNSTSRSSLHLLSFIWTLEQDKRQINSEAAFSITSRGERWPTFTHNVFLGWNKTTSYKIYGPGNGSTYLLKNELQYSLGYSKRFTCELFTIENCSLLRINVKFYIYQWNTEVVIVTTPMNYRTSRKLCNTRTLISHNFRNEQSFCIR